MKDITVKDRIGQPFTVTLSRSRAAAAINRGWTGAVSCYAPGFRRMLFRDSQAAQRWLGQHFTIVEG